MFVRPAFRSTQLSEGSFAHSAHQPLHTLQAQHRPPEKMATETAGRKAPESIQARRDGQAHRHVGIPGINPSPAGWAGRGH